MYDSQKLGQYLHGDAFILVRHLDVVNMHIEAGYIDTVQPSLITASNYEVVNFTAGASDNYEMECWGYKSVRRHFLRVDFKYGQSTRAIS